jgi:hypothetical protein
MNLSARHMVAIFGWGISPSQALQFQRIKKTKKKKKDISFLQVRLKLTASVWAYALVHTATVNGVWFPNFLQQKVSKMCKI